jgi:anti-sigma factor RsiW
MIERDQPVTTEELHAYVDGELPASRRGTVEAWLASHPEDAARVAEWRAQANVIRARFGAGAGDAGGSTVRRLLHSRLAWAALAVATLAVALGTGGIVGWTMRGAAPAVAAQNGFEAYTTQALEAHKLYVVEVRHPVEVPGVQREHLVNWLSKRLGTPLRAPDLEPIGFKLVGGRLLPGPSGASAFFMYEGPSGERFTVYCAPSNAPMTAMRYRAAERFAAFYWVERNLTYVVSGLADRDRLNKIAEAVYDQLEKEPPQGGRS